MTLDELNAKIEALPLYPGSEGGGLATFLGLDRAEARHLRDERLGLLGCHAGMAPTQGQIDIVAHQLFPPPRQAGLI